MKQKKCPNQSSAYISPNQELPESWKLKGRHRKDTKDTTLYILVWSRIGFLRPVVTRGES